MRDKNRIDIFCRALAEIWKKFPDLRFGQLMTIVQRALGNEQKWFYMEDKELLDFIEKYIGGLEND